MTKTPHEYIRVTYEHIRVTHEYIRVTYEYTRVHTSNIRVHKSNIRVHTTKYGNIQVIYECISYIRMHRSNKHEMYRCSLYVSFLHVRGSCLAYTRERAQMPHASVPHTCATHVYQTQRPKYSPKYSFEEKR